MLLQDLLAAHRLCGAQLLLVADGQKALHDLSALGERGKRAVLAQHRRALLRLGRIDRSAGKDADGQHHAVDNDHAVLALEQRQQLLRVLGSVDENRVPGHIGAHQFMRRNVRDNKKPLDAQAGQLRAGPCQDRAKLNALQHQRRFLLGAGNIVRHKQNCSSTIHRISPLIVVVRLSYQKAGQKSTFSCKISKKFSLLALRGPFSKIMLI